MKVTINGTQYGISRIDGGIFLFDSKSGHIVYEVFKREVYKYPSDSGFSDLVEGDEAEAVLSVI